MLIDAYARALFTMMFVFIAIGLAVLAGLVWADYKWRKWIEDRRRDRQ